MFLTYDIVHQVPAHRIEEKYQFGSSAIAHWSQFCRKFMLEYLKGSSQRIGGPNKTVEIDESKFGRRKHGKGEQWVFGGVERESGKTFLVPVQDRTADTLMALISDWIEPGTTVITDCSVAYRGLEAHGYAHETVPCTIAFVNQQTGAHINTIQSTWHNVKVYLNAYNRKEDYIYDLAQYMFTARCRAENVDEFTKFIHIVSNKDWISLPTHNDSTGAT
jgi:transposase-like protein